MTIALIVTGFILGVGFTIGMIAVAICTGGIEVNDDSSMGNVSNYTGSSLDVLDLDKD